jgi:hypothetical protein
MFNGKTTAGTSKAEAFTPNIQVSGKDLHLHGGDTDG